jgi:transcriptional regulator with XRE-family HTH domain
MFEYVGETLRRLRKESGKTLEQISKEAHLGRGQLSRIETSQQSATLKTLAKILASQRLTRREFFRRYELVETELVAARGAQPLAGGAAVSSGAAPPESEGAYPLNAQSAWPNEVREALSRVESFITNAFNPDRPLAQGAIELGDLLILFRVVPKSAVPPASGAALGRDAEMADTAAASSAPSAPPAPSKTPPKPRRSRRGKKR